MNCWKAIEALVRLKVSKMKAVDLIYFYFSIFLFLELRVRVRVMRSHSHIR